MNIKEQVNEYIKWEKLMAQAKVEMTNIKAELLKEGINLLENTKFKTTVIRGDESNLVKVQTTEKADYVSVEVLKDILGNVADEFITKETNYKVSSKLTNILIPLATENYKEGNLDDLLATLTTDEKSLKLLKKKIKGNFEKDTQHLITILNLSNEEASKIAYEITEVVNYTKLNTLIQAIKKDNSFADVKDRLEKCIVVEENVKLTAEYE